MVKKLIILIAIFVFAGVCYFNPTKEVMECNQNLYCSIKQKYLCLYTVNRNFNLLPYSNIDFDIKKRDIKQIYYLTYVKYNDKKPFTRELGQFESLESAEKSTNKESRRFAKYLRKHENNYFIKSCANPIETFFWLFLYGIIFTIIFISDKENNPLK